MPGKHAAHAITGALLLALFLFPFLTRSVACEQRLDIYFYAGVAALLAVAAVPFVMPAGRPMGARVGWSFAFAAACVLVWLAGLFAGDVRIMCRLF